MDVVCFAFDNFSSFLFQQYFWNLTWLDRSVSRWVDLSTQTGESWGGCWFFKMWFWYYASISTPKHFPRLNTGIGIKQIIVFLILQKYYFWQLSLWAVKRLIYFSFTIHENATANCRKWQHRNVYHDCPNSGMHTWLDVQIVKDIFSIHSSSSQRDGFRLKGFLKLFIRKRWGWIFHGRSFGIWKFPSNWSFSLGEFFTQACLLRACLATFLVHEKCLTFLSLFGWKLCLVEVGT